MYLRFLNQRSANKTLLSDDVQTNDKTVGKSSVDIGKSPTVLQIIKLITFRTTAEKISSKHSLHLGVNMVAEKQY